MTPPPEPGGERLAAGPPYQRPLSLVPESPEVRRYALHRSPPVDEHREQCPGSGDLEAFACPCGEIQVIVCDGCGKLLEMALVDGVLCGHALALLTTGEVVP